MFKTIMMTFKLDKTDVGRNKCTYAAFHKAV